MTESEDQRPDGDQIAALLAERWPTQPDETVAVAVESSDDERVVLTLESPRHRYTLTVTLRQAPANADRWALLVDALDGLFGQLIESGRAHRTLPTGVGVEFQGGEFEVVVERTVPELEKAAEQILAQDGSQSS